MSEPITQSWCSKIEKGTQLQRHEPLAVIHQTDSNRIDFIIPEHGSQLARCDGGSQLIRRRQHQDEIINRGVNRGLGGRRGESHIDRDEVGFSIRVAGGGQRLQAPARRLRSDTSARHWSERMSERERTPTEPRFSMA